MSWGWLGFGVRVLRRGEEGQAMTQRTLTQLADDLRMFASQIDEHAEDPANNLPSPHRLDDWLNDFRECAAARKAER